MKQEIPFIKMHGISNDFIIIDHRLEQYSFNPAEIAHRKIGVGCDQLIVIEESYYADCLMRIYNADGSEVGACGNATRCVAHLLMQEQRVTQVKIMVQNRILPCWRIYENTIKVDMGKPELDWQKIPLATSCDTLKIPIAYGALSLPVGVNMGNPHAVFFVDNVDEVNLQDLGPMVAHDPIFPAGVNVNVAAITDNNIKLRVWERGVGETDACGSGACASLVAAVRRKYLNKNHSTISLNGGCLDVLWDDHVFMTGTVATVFTGKIINGQN